MTDNGNSAEKSLGDVVNDVSTKASMLVREEIELAKTEIAEKAKSLGKGVAGTMAGLGLHRTPLLRCLRAHNRAVCSPWGRSRPCTP